MILATFWYGLMNLFVKLLGEIPSHEIVFFRSLVTLVITWVLLRRRRISPWGKNRNWLILRGLAGFIGLTLYFYTVQHISLASAVTIQYLSPIFTGIFAIFLLGERMRWLQWIFFGLAFLGVIIIKGFDPTVSPMWLGLGIGSAVFSGLAYNVIRKLRGKEDPLVIVFYFPLVVIPLIGPYTLTHFHWPTLTQWGLLLAVGVSTQFAQVLMTRAYQLEEVANVSILTYLGTIYALILGTLVFDEQYSWQALSGMGMIVIGIILSILYKNGRWPFLVKAA